MKCIVDVYMVVKKGSVMCACVCMCPNSPCVGGGTLPCLKVVGNIPGIDPSFGIFPLSAEINWFSVSHLVPEIIWPRSSSFFHQSLSVLKHFVSISSLIIDLVDPLFHCLQLGPFFRHMLDSPTKHLLNYIPSGA